MPTMPAATFFVTPAQALAATRLPEGMGVALRDGRTLIARPYGWAVLDPMSGLGPVPVSDVQADRILRGMLPAGQTHGPSGGLISQNAAR